MFGHLINGLIKIFTLVMSFWAIISLCSCLIITKIWNHRSLKAQTDRILLSRL